MSIFFFILTFSGSIKFYLNVRGTESRRYWYSFSALKFRSYSTWSYFTVSQSCAGLLNRPLL